MKNNKSPLYSILVLIATLFGVFYFMMPQSYDETEVPLSEFSSKRALEKVKIISQKPHFVGSKNHEDVAQYLVNELKNLGLSTSIQEGFTLSDGGTLVKSKNIVARIKGTSKEKALLLLSHYDSAPHSYSFGASDDGVGIAVIVECVRAFLHNKAAPKNDIIVLFSDAEEVGLNGAALFVAQHQWAKNVGLVLNLEARGSSGPSYMLMETNKGNANMVKAFADGNANYPVSNSLMYSIYKMLPNDTDLTVFREQGKIQGFNFAFIDNHFNYHTARDNYENLDPKTIAHQGSYIFPLLNYFSQAELSNLNSDEEYVYFSVPFSFIHYPFSWIIPMLIIAVGLVFSFLFIGIGKQILRMDEVIKGFVPLFASLVVAGGITYIGWKLLLNCYPQYNDILHGFTYNGHDYIYAFVSLSIAICFLFYQNSGKRNPEMNQFFAPLFIWVVLNIGIAIFLKGAGFLIIPLISSALMLGVFVVTQKSNGLINCILSIPTLIIIVPFIQMFPIGLGLKVLFGSAILTVLAFGLLVPIFGSFTRKGIWSVVFFLVSIGMFIKAHQSSTYTTERPKPNSLVYLHDADQNKSFWITYDLNLDEWTKGYLGENPKKATAFNQNALYSKYENQFTYVNNAPLKNIMKPSIEFLRDTVKGNQHLYKIKITPNRAINRYDVFSNTSSSINNLKVNGVKAITFNSKIDRKTKEKLLSYYVVDTIPLVMEFSIKATEKLDLTLMESSFDLMSNSEFTVANRKSWMMPMPFVLTDAVIIRQKIQPTPILEDNSNPYPTRRFVKKDSVTITAADSLTPK
jgi:hypothetical protein